jgi:streptomycin 6-kinase
LPSLVESCADDWSLELGSPFEPAHISFVAPATLADGARAVLKVNFPEPDSEHEAQALQHWDAVGAVALLAHDQNRRALLVERCEPGDELWSLEEDEANGIAADVLLRLWRPPAPGHPFRLLADEALSWAEQIPREWERHGRPFGRRVLDEAVGFLREAGTSQGEDVVLHQDLHGGNVLRSERGWLAIDPKPLVGEREFDTASLLRDRRDELAQDRAAARQLRRRLDQLCSVLNLDRDRARRWGVAHALAWGFSGRGWDDEMVACARWLSEA